MDWQKRIKSNAQYMQLIREARTIHKLSGGQARHYAKTIMDRLKAERAA